MSPRPSWRVLVLCLGLGCTLLAQINGSRIEGKITDFVSGQPISGARIVMYADPKESTSIATATASTDGHFTLENVRLPRVTIYAAAEGYVAAEDRVSLSGSPIVKVDEIRLVPTGAITGRVLNTNGRAAVAVLVIPQLMVADGTLQESYGRRNNITNNRGEFRVFDLRPGRYVIGFSGDRNAGRVPQVPVYYPGVDEPSRAVVIEVLPGREMRLGDVVLQPHDLSGVR